MAFSWAPKLEESGLEPEICTKIPWQHRETILVRGWRQRVRKHPVPEIRMHALVRNKCTYTWLKIFELRNKYAYPWQPTTPIQSSGLEWKNPNVFSNKKMRFGQGLDFHKAFPYPFHEWGKCSSSNLFWRWRKDRHDVWISIHFWSDETSRRCSQLFEKFHPPQPVRKRAWPNEHPLVRSRPSHALLRMPANMLECSACEAAWPFRIHTWIERVSWAARCMHALRRSWARCTRTYFAQVHAYLFRALYVSTYNQNIT